MDAWTGHTSTQSHLRLPLSMPEPHVPRLRSTGGRHDGKGRDAVGGVADSNGECLRGRRPIEALGLGLCHR
jgi:hypothetical protein